MSTYGPWPATTISEHDGDTLRVKLTCIAPEGTVPVDVGWNVWLHPGSGCDIVVDVRTFGDNAAELATPAGKLALAYLQSLLPVGAPVQVLSHGPDKWGNRWDCSITLRDGRDLVATMIAANAAAPWGGLGPKPVPVGPITEGHA